MAKVWRFGSCSGQRLMKLSGIEIEELTIRWLAQPEERAASLSNRVAWMKRCAARWNHCSVMMSGEAFHRDAPG